MGKATIVLKNNSDARLLNLHVTISRPDMILFDDDVDAADRDPLGNPSVVKVRRLSLLLDLFSLYHDFRHFKTPPPSLP
jgi:hypothetical protein